MDDGRTIAALATAPGMAGVAVVRVSGPDSLGVLHRCFSRRGDYEPRKLYHGRVLLAGQPVERALAVWFRAPHSYTGEDAAELHCHGGQEAVRATLEALFAAGAAPAEPGEFTRRAFLHGRMDLSQAEAVMDVIAARAEGAHRLALGQLEGRLGREVSTLADDLLTLLAEVEVTVDYPEEDLEERTTAHCVDRLTATAAALERLLGTARAGRTLREGLRCAIVGRPNAGKSSLLNALLGEDRAIVTATPGTTRDTLDAEADLDGLAVTFVDTAGIRHSDDEVERLGVERARRALTTAGVAVLVVDGSQTLNADDRDIAGACAGLPLVVALNKADLPQALMPGEAAVALGTPHAVALSARTGQGVDGLRTLLRHLALGSEALGESAVLANLRHIECARQAHAALGEALAALRAGFPPDTAAIDIRRAWHALGQITGGTVDEDVIDLIFSRFCLGK